MDFLLVLKSSFAAMAESIVYLLIYQHFLNKDHFLKNNKVKVLLFIVVNTVFQYYLSTYFPEFHTYIIALYQVLFLSFIMNTSLIRSFIIEVVSLVFIMISDVIAYFSFMIISGMDMAQINNSPIVGMAVITFSTVLKFLIVFIIYKTNVKLFKKENKLSKLNNNIIYFFMQLFLFMCLVVNLSYAVNSKINILVFQIFLIFTVCLSLIIGYFEFKERRKIITQQLKFESQEENSKNMESIIKILRSERHEIGNNYNAFLALSQTESPESFKKIQEFAKSLIGEMHTFFKTYYTGNEYINGLLSVKNNQAYEKGISLVVDFESKLDLIEIDNTDLISIIGNLIDNAIHALSILPHKENRYIAISGYIENEKYLLSVCDDGIGIPKENLSKVFEQGFSTKTTDKDNHGFGLYIVKKLVEKNGGEITVTSNDGQTDFLMKYPLKK